MRFFAAMNGERQHSWVAQASGWLDLLASRVSNGGYPPPQQRLSRRECLYHIIYGFNNRECSTIPSEKPIKNTVTSSSRRHFFCIFIFFSGNYFRILIICSWSICSDFQISSRSSPSIPSALSETTLGLSGTTFPLMPIL